MTTKANTGTQDTTYNLLSILYHALQGAETYEVYINEPNEYEAARLEGSKLIPLGQVVNRRDEIDESRETIVHCKLGGRSAKAIEALRRAGFTGRLVNLTGGITAWSNEVDPTVKKY